MPNWELIAVATIVGAALVWALRGLWRAARQQRVCGDCASSGGCPLAGEDKIQTLDSACQAAPLEAGHGKDN